MSATAKINPDDVRELYDEVLELFEKERILPFLIFESKDEFFDLFIDMDYEWYQNFIRSTLNVAIKNRSEYRW